MAYKIKLIVGVILLISAYTSAHDVCKISGWVSDSVSHNSMPNVYVIVDDSNQVVTTDSAGYFHLDLSSNKTHSIKFSHLGYEDVVRRVHLAKGEEVEYNIYLSSRLIELSPIVSISVYENERSFLTFNEDELKKAGGNDLVRAMIYLTPNIIFANWLRTRFSGRDNLNNALYHNFTLYVNGKLTNSSDLEDIAINTIKLVKIWRKVKSDYGNFVPQDEAPVSMPTIEGNYTILIVIK